MIKVHRFRDNKVWHIISQLFKSYFLNIEVHQFVSFSKKEVFLSNRKKLNLKVFLDNLIRNLRYLYGMLFIKLN